ncbi:MAG: hypothetical protein ABIH99_02185 [Candidatus Micrarchaeota archaeon]
MKKNYILFGAVMIAVLFAAFLLIGIKYRPQSSDLIPTASLVGEPCPTICIAGCIDGTQECAPVPSVDGVEEKNELNKSLYESYDKLRNAPKTG